VAADIDPNMEVPVVWMDPYGKNEDPPIKGYK
jgi:hypothetical protein